MSLLALTTFRLPPMPAPLTGTHIAIGIGAVVLGVAMALQGLRLIRWPMAVAGAVLGALLGSQLQQFNEALDASTTVYISAGVLGVIFFVAARFLTGLIGGVLLALAVVFWMITSPDPTLQVDGMSYRTDGIENLSEWPIAFLQDVWTYLGGLVEQKAWAPLGLVGVALLIPIVLGVLLRKLTTMATTAVLGVVLVTIGAMVVLAYLGWVNDVPEVLASRQALIAMGAGALVAFGVQVITLPRHKALVNIADDDSAAS
jgi:hypothetical protein